MQPKVKVALSIFTFVAMVLTGLAAAEQVPTHPPRSNESLLSPGILSLSPKVVQPRHPDTTIHPDSLGVTPH